MRAGRTGLAGGDGASVVLGEVWACADSAGRGCGRASLSGLAVELTLVPTSGRAVRNVSCNVAALVEDEDGRGSQALHGDITDQSDDHG